MIVFWTNLQQKNVHLFQIMSGPISKVRSKNDLSYECYFSAPNNFLKLNYQGTEPYQKY